MKVSRPVIKALRRLEENFINPGYRANPEIAAEVFADDFIEVGKSGRCFTKAEIISDLKSESFSGDRVITGFKAKALAQGLVLVTYLITTQDKNTNKTSQSVRSSIWKHHEDRWQILFHQGTPRVRN